MKRTASRSVFFAFGLAVLSAQFVILLLILTRVVAVYPTNHWGYHPGLLYALTGIMPLSLVALWGPRGWEIVGASVALAVTLVVLVALFDHWNILVQYDSWLARGMPEWGSR